MKKNIIAIIMIVGLVFSGCGESDNATVEGSNVDDTVLVVEDTKKLTLGLENNGSIEFSFIVEGSAIDENTNSENQSSALFRSYRNEIDTEAATNATGFMNILPKVVQYAIDEAEYIELCVSGDNIYYYGDINKFSGLLIPGEEYYVSFQFYEDSNISKQSIGYASGNIIVENGKSYSINFSLYNFPLDVKVDIADERGFDFKYYDYYYNDFDYSVEAVGDTFSLTLKSDILMRGDYYYLTNGKKFLIITNDVIESIVDGENKTFNLSDNPDLVLGELSLDRMVNNSFNNGYPINFSTMITVNDSNVYNVNWIYPGQCKEIVLKDINQTGIELNGEELNISSDYFSIQVKEDDNITVPSSINYGYMELFYMTECPEEEVSEVNECDDMITRLGLCDDVEESTIETPISGGGSDTESESESEY